MKKITFLVLAFIAAFAVSCGDGNKDKPECVGDYDCTENQECNSEGVCVDKPEPPKPECVTSEDCSDGKECKDGSCVTPAPVEPEEYCGDGIVNGEEACDDGAEANDGHYGGCNEDCTLAAYCGDGIVNGEEACDKGTEANIGGYNGCKADCTLDERCGDGVKNGTEECDDGENNGTYGYCNALCAGVGDYCGDGIVNGEEACDDGENNGKYGKCNTECTGLGDRCGDAVIQKAVCPEPAAEESDADTETPDTETPDTETPDTETPDTEVPDTETPDTEAPDTPEAPAEECVVKENANENCDEGELNGVYGHCNAECTGFYGCGDGVLQEDQGEECDYGINNGTEYCNYGEEGQEGVPCKRCTVDCKLSEEDATLNYCGDAAIVGLNGEVCDDGKATNGTVYGQCNADCTSLMVCGDGVTQRVSCSGYDNCTEVADANEICDSNTKSCKEIAPVFSAESEALCSECSSWDESTCQCEEYYSGNGCLSCDGAHFCNGHGTCTADRQTATVTCSCTDHFTGPNCSECEDKYHLNDAGTMCIKDCDSSCGQASFLINPASHGHCDYSGEKGVCVCDPCWITTGVALILPTFETPECAQYTPNVPGC